MLLSDARETGEYIIKKVNLAASQKTRLCRLLIAEKRKIKVLFLSRGKAVVFADGTTIGLSKTVCEKIETERLKREKRRIWGEKL